jgi:hypothetical protein
VADLSRVVVVVKARPLGRPRSGVALTATTTPLSKIAAGEGSPAPALAS